MCAMHKVGNARRAFGRSQIQIWSPSPHHRMRIFGAAHRVPHVGSLKQSDDGLERLFTPQELTEKLTKRWNMRPRAGERALCSGVHEHASTDWVALAMIAIEEIARSISAHFGAELPPEIGRIGQPRIEARTPGGKVNVRGVASEENAPFTVLRRLPTRVG